MSVGDPFLREEALEGENAYEQVDEDEVAPEFKEIRSEGLRGEQVRKSRR